MEENWYYSFLKSHKYKGISPISDEYPHVFNFKDGTIIKVTCDEDEVTTALKIKGVESELWAKVISVRRLDEYGVIVVEKIEPLTEEYIFLYKIFMIKILLIVGLINLVKLFTFKKVSLKIDSLKWLHDSNVTMWLTFARSVISEARINGINHASDFLTPSNMGIKNGKLACFDIQDKYDEVFYDKL